MTTDELIHALAADLTPVNRRRIAHLLAAALVLGAMMAFGAMFLVVGPRPEGFRSPYLHFELAKLLFTLSVVAIAALHLPQLARPGELRPTFFVVVCIPFVAMVLFSIASIVSAEGSNQINMLVGETWPTCLVFIPLLAVAPFTTIVSALRAGAPTNLTATGSAAGLVAGGLVAMACSLTCLDDSLPSIAAWYGSMIVACAVVGAKLGPELLRW
jgi:hypothetical protein